MADRSKFCFGYKGDVPLYLGEKIRIVIEGHDEMLDLVVVEIASAGDYAQITASTTETPGPSEDENLQRN